MGDTKAIVLHSGGMDSTVCLLLASEKHRTVISLGIDYGQTSRAELEYAERLCVRFGIERRVLYVQWDKPVRELPMNRKVEEIRSGVSPGFLPGRNALFLVLACAEAAGIGASEVWIGVNSRDYSGYPDSRPEFLDSFQKMIDIAMPGAPRVVAPLSSLSKPEIALEAHRLELLPDDTWSCYRPISLEEGYQPCGRCDACVLHRYAWEKVFTPNIGEAKD